LKMRNLCLDNCNKWISWIISIFFNEDSFINNNETISYINLEGGLNQSCLS
jgi:hypothetical protein